MENKKLNDCQVNIDKSKDIFGILTKGGMVNKHHYNAQEHSVTSNDLFLEIESNIEQYKLQYRMAGLDLVDAVDYFYLLDHKTESRTNSAHITKNKIYSSIIILVRYITQDNGKLFESITNINYGFNEGSFKDIDSKPIYVHLLEKTRLNNISNMIKLLSEKGFIFKTKNNMYVLSDSGKRVVKEIVESNKERI